MKREEARIEVIEAEVVSGSVAEGNYIVRELVRTGRRTVELRTIYANGYAISSNIDSYSWRVKRLLNAAEANPALILALLMALVGVCGFLAGEEPLVFVSMACTGFASLAVLTMLRLRVDIGAKTDAENGDDEASAIASARRTLHLVRLILRVLIKKDVRVPLLGDLEEEFADVLDNLGPKIAKGFILTRGLKELISLLIPRRWFTWLGWILAGPAFSLVPLLIESGRQLLNR
ncbi:hypothetical protein EON81_16875 [bacterium]|nr:MAG: hypothetical protein EON81_16875 [bacterium]